MFSQPRCPPAHEIFDERSELGVGRHVAHPRGAGRGERAGGGGRAFHAAEHETLGRGPERLNLKCNKNGRRRRGERDEEEDEE